MTDYGFDQVISRENTHSMKWEYGKKISGDSRMLPMWVADMDFRSPPKIIEAVEERARHGIYGYTLVTNEYLESIAHWMEKRHNWSIDVGEIVSVNGVVPALNMIMQGFGRPGDHVVIQPPVYYPFFNVIRNNGHHPLLNSLVEKEFGYEMDFDDLEMKLKHPGTTMMILCSPHNPVGRVWKEEELRKVAELCLQYNVLLISDEIHQDLLLNNHRHIPTASISEAVDRNTITCTAPSKTFNLAGFHSSNLVIRDSEKRRIFRQTLERNGGFGMNPFSDIATITAYRHGASWLDALLQYLEGNLEYLRGYLNHHLPEISMHPPEATYLAWLDCRSLKLEQKELEEVLLKKAGVVLNQGPTFGDPGEGFVRLNFACPRSMLEEGLQRIKTAIHSL